VTRDDETNEHVIKPRGRDPDNKWTRRVPATHTDVEEGDKLWSIPDNWTHSYTLKPDHGSQEEIYHIPETGEDVLVSLTHPIDTLPRLKTRESHGTAPLRWDIKVRG
jgi:hypothetical protein